MVAAEFLYPKLRGRIIEKYQSYTAFADAINEHKTVVSRKLTGAIGFTKQDIIKWCNALDIASSEIGQFFFEEIVH